MGFGKNAMVFLFMVVVEVSMASGVVYKVGDSLGWTNIGNFDYKAWSSNKTFHVGDTIVFNYNKQFHNVLRVTHQQFRDCNNTAPIATFTSGTDSFSVRRPGHYYFICGVSDHCQTGQKVDIRVPKFPSPAPAPFAPVVPLPSPGMAPAVAPAPKKSGSSIVMVNKIWWSLLVLAFCV
ncbi:hypothetical protein LguiA_026623 [Lonicera macranthoides]